MYKVLTINVFVIIIFYKDNKIHEYIGIKKETI